MTILGSHHFLLFPSQKQFVSPKLRSCMVEKSLGSAIDYSFSISMIFGNPWLSEDIILFIIISVLLILAFFPSIFQRPRNFLQRLPVGQGLNTRFLELSCHTGIHPNWFFQLDFISILAPPCFLSSTFQRPQNSIQLPKIVIWRPFQGQPPCDGRIFNSLPTSLRSLCAREPAMYSTSSTHMNSPN